MPQHMTTPPDIGWVDPRRSPSNDNNFRGLTGPTTFTANAAGTTTTIVGANATPGTTNANVIRVGEKVKIKTGAGVLKEETVFTVTNVTVAASTTVTFSPAAAVATASGDTLTLVGTGWFDDNETLDRRLNAINSTLYSQANLDRMTQNDKVFALRLADDPGSF